jgi:hypothetical protein
MMNIVWSLVACRKLGKCLTKKRSKKAVVKRMVQWGLIAEKLEKIFRRVNARTATNANKKMQVNLQEMMTVMLRLSLDVSW